MRMPRPRREENASFYPPITPSRGETSPRMDDSLPSRSRGLCRCCLCTLVYQMRECQLPPMTSKEYSMSYLVLDPFIWAITLIREPG
ncbi:hypothetical protein BDV37DRAFT_235761 [Aspergillus pseudonomiae]|uniref:Uncharacterized protein n=1 Tax=Aspergillus pseudonomiae TaxID=1506151 RepID=A0A5N7DTQ7_9EURO|nr:uncharacterized protein BDV37DRAFT_235761 [Aspergillus pseudonomiae]KAE8409419.1 hypothetical protein BDV37DRAFT_235761 [Aspergillus pseudonomiae]